jgi:hypothetical protein
VIDRSTGAIERRWALDSLSSVASSVTSTQWTPVLRLIMRSIAPSVTSSVASRHWAQVLRLFAGQSVIDRSSRELCFWSTAVGFVWELVVILWDGSTSTSLPFFLMYSQASWSTSSSLGWREFSLEFASSFEESSMNGTRCLMLKTSDVLIWLGNFS